MMGAEGMFCSSLQVNTGNYVITISVIILDYPKKLKHNLEHNSCVTGYEFHPQLFAFPIQ